MSAIKDKDRLGSYNRELNNILSEADRKRINQVLKQFSTTRKEVPTLEKKKKKHDNVPHIMDLNVHDEFHFRNAPQELDEIPHLFLFRTFFAPIIHHKKPVTLAKIQYLCTKCGVSNVVHDSVNKKVDRVSGKFEKGGLVKSIILYLEKEEQNLYIKQCIFKGLVQ